MRKLLFTLLRGKVLWSIVVGQLLFGSSPCCIAQTQSQQQSAPATLTNKDVLDLFKNGLVADAVADKVKASVGQFDTSPTALKALRDAGLPDQIIWAMVERSAETGKSQPTSPESTPAVPVPEKKTPLAKSERTVKEYTLSYVKSSRKWQLGFRHEPFDKISEYTQDHLLVALEKAGIKRMQTLEGSCCQVSIELLQVSTRQAVIKKPGIDVAANLTITDANNKIIFARGYQGRSGTAFMNTWGHLINGACEDMVKNISADEAFLSVLRTGQL
jgi:hypothetical protein